MIRLLIKRRYVRSGLLLGLGMALLALSGCARTIVVTSPPKMDLRAYATIGVITFDTSATTDPALQEDITLLFMESIQKAQPGVRLLELGSERQLLGDVGGQSLDPAAIAAIGARNNVDAIITGHLDISTPKPNVQLSGSLTSLNAQASVTGTFNAKLRETGRGATIWTASARDKRTIANVDVTFKGPTNLGFTDPKEKYRVLAANLVRHATVDFYPTYQRRTVEE